MEYIVCLIMRFLDPNQEMDEDRKEILQYGLELLLLKIGFSLALILVGIVIGKVAEIVLFFIMFMPLRSMAGGYHADTRIKCFVLSMGMMGIVLFLISILSNSLYAFYVLFLLSIAATGFIWKTAPVDTENKRLEEEESVQLRKRVRMILIFEWIFIAVGAIINWELILYTGVIVIAVNGVLQVLQYVKNQKACKLV